jgi:chromate transporter
MVLQFVGFLGGWNHPGTLPPLSAATLGAFITTWTTFVPSFLLILIGAPYMERLRGNIRLASALAAVTAAVVGVILNLSVWFGIHVLFPAGATPNWFGLALSLIAFMGMARWNWAIAPVVLGGAVAGLIRMRLSG